MIGYIMAAVMSIPSQGVTCEGIQTLSLPETTIISSVDVPAGVFVWPEDAPAPPGVPTDDPEPVPDHCRVKMVLTPTLDSEIHVELWLPVHNWNGKYLAVGNGGWAGYISGYADMKTGLRKGYATASTDMGHQSSTVFSGMFALGHPEKIIDFAYRATHLMNVRSKQVINAYYDHQINYSYYIGCSTGGRQGVMSAQRYPGDFDGIIAGALANRHIRMHTSDVALNIRLMRNPGEALPAGKAALVNESVMKTCDTLDEGFLNNPRQCSFDFSSLRCGWWDKDDCLTRAQLKTVDTFYNGLETGKGELVFTGQAIGNPIPELTGTLESERVVTFDTVKILGFQDADYDWRTFDLDRDMPIIDKAAGFIDAVDTDLSAYKAHGGKLLMYHGWVDPGISPENTVDYYEGVLEEMGNGQDDWIRLFMVPGMGHCRGGDGPHRFDRLGALEKWREEGIAPDRIMGSNPESGLQRPLCPYPQYARYDGTGNLKDSSSWTCSLQ